jgi:hypothetical protein
MSQMDKSFVIGLTILLLVGIFFGCGYREQVIARNEVSALLELKLINQHELRSYVTTKKFVPLDQLVSQADGIPPPSRSNPDYRFEVRVNEDGKSFEAFASPAQYSKTGRRSFYINEQGVIHGADKRGEEASATDPEIK